MWGECCVLNDHGANRHGPHTVLWYATQTNEGHQTWNYPGCTSWKFPSQQEETFGTHKCPCRETKIIQTQKVNQEDL